MKSRLAIYLFLFLLFFTGCTGEEIETPSNRTVLMYIVADNNLNTYGYNNIDYILRGAGENRLNGGHLLVYFDPADDVPRLYEIEAANAKAAKQSVVKIYEEQNSLSTEVMGSVIEEALRYAPADEYGLVLWSHGTAWFPSTIFNMLRSFGQDKGQEMDIRDLAKALPDHTFDFILFDACYMASTEVIYELRNKANYIIASPTETLAQGFPYDRIIAPLFKPEADLEKVCSAFYNYYLDQSNPLYQSATVSLTATAPMQKLAATVREIVKGKEETIFSLPIQEMQQLEYITTYYHALYDFDDFIARLATPEQYEAFRQCLEQTVLYQLATPRSTYAYNDGTQIEMKHFSGLSIYVPQQALPSLNEWYKNTAWYQAVFQ